MICQVTRASHKPSLLFGTKGWTAIVLNMVISGWALLGLTAAHADGGIRGERTASALGASTDQANVEKASHRATILKSYPMGITKYKLDHATQVTGWQVGDRWYFGRARGEDSGLALIWQLKASQQMSLSSDGVRFTHRF